MTDGHANIPGLEPKWLEIIHQWAHEQHRVDSIYLFGSRAKQTHNLESDIDLAFWMNGTANDTPYGYWMSAEFKVAISNLRTLLPVPLDLQFIDPVHDEIVAPNVRKHGVLLFIRPGTPTIQDWPLPRPNQDA